MATSAPDENVVSTEQKWGRVLICGGTDWPRLGRKSNPANVVPDTAGPDLPNPHILRSLANVKAVSVHTSHSGCHAIVLDITGHAFLFGRSTPPALGIPPTLFVSEDTPIRLSPSELGAPLGTKFVHAACGRAHSLLVGSNGDVWSAGLNTLGQCGHNPPAEVYPFKLINGPWTKGLPTKDKVVQAAAGLTFSLVLTESGKVYSFGSGEQGQLGNGRTGEHITSKGTAFDIESYPVPVRGLEGKKIVQIACGQQHSLLLDSAGFVYAFGAGGYCRTGFGSPADVLIPKLVPQFDKPSPAQAILRGQQIAAGPTSCVVIDRQGMYWLAGKWKTSGEGSAGQPYSTFRYIQDIMTCKILRASCGGVTHFVITPLYSDPAEGQEEEVMTVAWGQNAHNFELGLGEGAAKSATKPLQVHPLDGIDVFDVAAGAHTTFFVATPNSKLSELPRHPVDLNPPAPDYCMVCQKGDDESSVLLECEKCESPYHLACLDPPLSDVPEGEWFCPICETEYDDSAKAKIKAKKKAAPKRKEHPTDGDGVKAAVPKKKK